MTPRLVICDLDGTLIRCSSEKGFLMALLRQGGIPPKRCLGYLWGYARHPLRTAAEGRGWNRGYLKGVSPEAADRAADRLAPVLQAEVRTEVADLLEKYKRNGARLFMMSASLECLVERMAEMNGFEGFIGSSPEIAAGSFTGRIMGSRPWGKAKVTAAKTLMASLGVTPDETVAIGDSYSDRHLMLFCARAVAVHPGARLAALARGRGWRVLN